MRSVPQEAELRLSVLSDWDTDYKRKLEQSYIVHCCIIFINPTKLGLMKILSPFSSFWKTPEISLPCWIIRLKKEKAYLTKCLFTIFKIHQFSVHLMWNQKKELHQWVYRISHLGVHVGYLDTIQPPGDHCGGVGAVWGARHCVALIRSEWLLGTGGSVRGTQRCHVAYLSTRRVDGDQ